MNAAADMDVDGVFREGAFVRMVKRRNEPRTWWPMQHRSLGGGSGDKEVKPHHALRYRFENCVINFGGTGTVDKKKDLEAGSAFQKILSELYHDWGILVRV